MSAWLCSDLHICAMVQAGIEVGVVDPLQATEVGTAFKRENHLSLLARYNDPMPDPVEFVFEGVEAPLDPASVGNTFACWNYQACEHQDAFYESEAYALALRINDAWAAKVGVPVDTGNLYRLGDWHEGLARRARGVGRREIGGRDFLWSTDEWDDVLLALPVPEEVHGS